MTELKQIIIQIGLQILIALALIIPISLFTKMKNKKLLFIYFLCFISILIAYFIPKSTIFDSLKMNWQGQILVIILSISFVYFTHFITPKQVGFTSKINKTVWLPLIFLSILGIMFNLFVRGLDGISTTTEYLLYQLTMPSLAEEMAFRGVLLGLLNFIFISRKKIFGADIGWGAIILSLAFGLGHSIYFDENNNIQFAFDAFLVTTVLALVMTYLKEKGESIIPSIIFHSIYNASLPLIKIFL